MTVEERLEKLERQNRRLTVGLIGSLAVIVSGFLMGFGVQDGDVPDEIKAKKFVVANDDGNKLAALGHDPDEISGRLDIYEGDRLTSAAAIWAVEGGAFLSMSNSEGKPIFGCGGSSETHGGSLAIYDNNEKTLIMLDKSTHGDGVIATYRNDGKPLVEISSERAESGKVVIRSKSGLPIISLSGSSGEQFTAGEVKTLAHRLVRNDIREIRNLPFPVAIMGGMYLSGESESPSGVVKTMSRGNPSTVAMSSDLNGNGALVVWNKNSRPIFDVFTTTDGDGLVASYNSHGEKAVELGVATDGEGVVTTLNGKGQELVRLGVTEGGSGTITTLNADGHELIKFRVTTGGEGVVATFNGQGQELVKLGVTESGSGTVTTLNGKGQELVWLGTTTEGEGALRTLNGKGQELVKISALENGEGAIAIWSPNNPARGRVLDAGP